MKKSLWVVGLAALAAVGAAFLFRAWKKGKGPYHFIDEWPAEKNFGAFPPEVPYSEFNGVNFLT